MRTRIAIILAVCAALAVAGGTAFAQTKAGMATGPHDLRAGTNATGDWCKACHTPHNSSSTNLGLLWNHGASSATYTVWTPATGDFKGGTAAVDGTTPSGSCLSCHDGTVALNALYSSGSVGPPQTTGLNTGYTAGTLSGTAKLDTELRNDHPVGFSYATSYGAKPTGTLAADTAVTGAGLKLFGVNKHMECGTCHDPHGSWATGQYLLRLQNTNSTLCLTCHK